jgi:DNA modification methylase
MNDSLLTVIQGDALEKLSSLDSDSVQCCVTSPPYWGLRDYGTATWEGGNDDCDHKRFNAYLTGLNGTDEAQRNGKFFKDVCQKCGAKRSDSQLGLEETPEQYVTKMVEVFREVRRVLKNDGTLWLNLGDSYASDTKGSGGSSEKQLRNNGSRYENIQRLNHGLKSKDLCGIPWRVAFALQADGWYLRSDIIWHKPNPMPESVTDRPTKAHEYLFLLTKSERYLYDADAIREAYTGHATGADGYFGHVDATKIFKDRNDSGGTCGNGSSLGRNKRSVWTVPTAPYSEAHFATFPPDLIKPCILAGSRPHDIILDPFGGSGTTGMVAIEFGRKAILIELNPEYVSLINKRCSVTPGFAI